MLREAYNAHRTGLITGLLSAIWVGVTLLALLLSPSSLAALAPPALLALLTFALPPVRPHRPAFAIVVAGTALFLPGLEGAVRLRYFGLAAITDATSYAPWDGDKVGPGAFNGRYRGGKTTINQKGYRGPEIAPERPEGAARVMITGTSITFGMGVDDDDIYASVLEKNLTSKGTRAQVINLGVLGATSLKRLRLVEELLPVYKPEVVIIELHPGDLQLAFGEGNADIGQTSQKPSWVERNSFAAWGLYPPPNLRERLARFIPAFAPPKAPPAQGPTKKVGDAFFALAERGKAEGFSVVAFRVCGMHDFGAPPPETAVWAETSQKLEALGGAAVDTHGLFHAGEMPDDFIIFPGDLHPNREAHRRFAGALTPTVARLIEAQRAR